MSATRRSILAVSALLIGAATLAACTSTPAPEPTASQAVDTPSAAPSEEPQPSDSPTAAAELSCESILVPETVANMAEIGWTAQENPFYAGALELVDGIQCTWGDYSIATDHVQIYGWAPISAAETSTALDELVSTGWTREDSADGIYVTESADTAIATDGEGYGITYLFGDGWVTIADTKEGLLLIDRPDA